MLPLIVQAAASIFLASSLVNAQIVEIGQTCNLARNRITSTTHQFLSDCVPRAFCDPATSTCKPKVCRRDEFPFKFPPDTPETPLPPLCPDDQFCPDEGDGCLPKIPPGQNCQINRDDECQPDPSAPAEDLVDNPWNYKGAICLRFTCLSQRTKTQREIREYFHEQTTYRSSIIALHTAARDRTSVYSRSESRFSQYDEHGQMIYRDDDSQRQLLDQKRQSRLRQSVAADDEDDSDEETAQGRRLLGGAGPSGMASRDSFAQSRLSLADDTPRGSFDYGHAGSSNAGGYAAVPLRQSMDQQPKGGNFKDPWGQ
ncbi:hypothetical protein FRC01_010852 [Tulasnella sp. 417]|nr:hypothetical protein FRC01_010852 [Tulasnella sp. 417]